MFRVHKKTRVVKNMTANIGRMIANTFGKYFSATSLLFLETFIIASGTELISTKPKKNGAWYKKLR